MEEQKNMSKLWYVGVFIIPLIGIIGFFVNFRKDTKGSVMLLIMSIFVWIVYTAVYMSLISR